MAKTEEQLAAEKAAQQKAEKDAKLKALQAAMSKIEKDFGKGSIMRMGDENIEAVDVISTGSIGLDVALGVGGYPRGRIIEIYGPESSGKTTLAIHAIAEAQKKGGIAAFIDAEHAFDRFYAEKLGVDVDNLWISQPDNGEQALQIADQLISSSMYLSIGLGSFVMNDRQSTFCGLRSIRYTTSCATGFLTMTYPSLTLPMNHSEWNAGISVLLLALIITIRDHRPQALSMDIVWMFISSYISSR